MMYSDGISTVLSLLFLKAGKKWIEGNGDKIAVYVGSSMNVPYRLLFGPKIYIWINQLMGRFLCSVQMIRMLLIVSHRLKSKKANKNRI